MQPCHVHISIPFWQVAPMGLPSGGSKCTDLARLSAGSFAKEMQQSLSHAKHCFKRAQAAMSRHVNNKCQDAEYEVGDFVLLSAAYLRLRFEGSKKGVNKYFGPFEVVQRIGMSSRNLPACRFLTSFKSAFEALQTRGKWHLCTSTCIAAQRCY